MWWKPGAGVPKSAGNNTTMREVGDPYMLRENAHASVAVPRKPPPYWLCHITWGLIGRGCPKHSYQANGLPHARDNQLVRKSIIPGSTRTWAGFVSTGRKRRHSPAAPGEWAAKLTLDLLSGSTHKYDRVYCRLYVTWEPTPGRRGA